MSQYQATEIGSEEYQAKVYAGVLGKMIGVYLGRPFEGWSYERISRELGEIWYYVHEKLGQPLIVTDDDITGTFTFIRALEDYGCSRDITAEQIGQTWLNYLIENRTILWWGGMGMSTEHTAYLRLKEGIPAPRSGSCALNGQVVSEQIGAQIFIDAWAMVAPGDPDLAAELAWKAGSVSHDGEALYGAQVIAVMESLAFIESDLQVLLDRAISYIPQDSVIARMIRDIRAWHQTIPDWREARQKLDDQYGYDIYGGNCHMVPNHGLIILSLLYGEDDFQKSLMIVNTSGWDTDCNSANVGCLLGIKNGLAGLESGPDWRGPVADRMYLPTADGGRAISDALTEAVRIANLGRRLNGWPEEHPKQGARFHFEQPGSVQGFQVEDSTECRGTADLINEEGHSEQGQRCLAVHYHGVAVQRACRVATPVFIPPEASAMGGYSLIASPQLYSGQTVIARVQTGEQQPPVSVCLTVRYYGAEDDLVLLRGPVETLSEGNRMQLSWQIPDLAGYPIADVGLEIASGQRADGVIYLDSLTWSGQPQLLLDRPSDSQMWRQAWVNAVDTLTITEEPYRLIQNTGTGLIMQGTREWRDYQVSAVITPHLAEAAGIAARAQGMRRYYALLADRDQTIRLIRMRDTETILAEKAYAWSFGQAIPMTLDVHGQRIKAWLGDQLLFDVEDDDPLDGGAAALICREGRIASGPVRVSPVQ